MEALHRQAADLARQAVKDAAQLVAAKAGERRSSTKQGAHDLVTETDLASEQLILESIGRAFPQHSVLSEEAGVLTGDSTYQWVIDPVDGTTNFSFGYPAYCVAVSLLEEGEPVAAAIASVAAGEIFHAVKDGGAFRDEEQISVSRTERLADSLIAASFPGFIGLDAANVAVEMDRFGRIYCASRGARHDGSASFGMTSLACGRIDGFWESVLPLWDTAAGVLIIREAGGTVSDVDGSAWTTQAEGFVASNGLIHAELIDALAYPN